MKYLLRGLLGGVAVAAGIFAIVSAILLCIDAFAYADLETQVNGWVVVLHTLALIVSCGIVGGAANYLDRTS